MKTENCPPPASARVLAWLREFHAEYDRLPTTRQIARHFRYRSQTSALQHLQRLTRSGHLQHITLPHSEPFYRFPRPAP